MHLCYKIYFSRGKAQEYFILIFELERIIYCVKFAIKQRESLRKSPPIGIHKILINKLISVHKNINCAFGISILANF
jgi:hypothetical protein